MKKAVIFVIVLLILAALAGCGPNAPNVQTPQIMVNGTVYYLYGGKGPDIEVAENDYLGKVLSTVRLSQKAAKDGQANFGKKGAPYAKYGDGIVVLWNEKWTLFVMEEGLLSGKVYG